jgi:hypothetical protein
MRDPKSVSLEHVKYHDHLKAISYIIKLDGKKLHKLSLEY